MEARGSFSFVFEDEVYADMDTCGDNYSHG